MFPINKMLNFSAHQKIRTVAFVLLFIYLCLLFYVTLFAWNYGASLGPEGPGGRNFNLTPFRSIYRISVFSQDIMDPIIILLGNVMLFVPFGFLLPFMFKHVQKVMIKAVFICCVSSLFIEVCQFLFTYRVSNVDDVILNTFGGLIGVSIFVIIRTIKKRVVIFYKK
ncbi:VanZ family protein [Alkalihalobacillus sp. BA299]|uniref:VanZ family protein n=1 Tax=Alkalihalobacillus sp. BA299 TaxID=2815938 RepID=UPI0027DBCD94|nr:VanZ family protein [Alkalihalobacillus sp. BA299]